MELPGPGKTSSNWQPVIRELVFGRDSAKQLRGLLCTLARDGGLLKMSEGLVEKILVSFETALGILTYQGALEECLDFCHGWSHDSGKPKGVSENKRRRIGRRRDTSESWTRVSATPFEDGHAWRKYGEKEILFSKFPRSYFRCTYRDEQECLATKHVQKTDDNPSMYLITYSGHHTCRNLPKKSEPENGFISDPNGSNLSFESSSTIVDQAHLFTFPRQEESEELFGDLIHNQLLEDLLLPEDLPCATNVSPPMMDSDRDNIVPGMCSSGSFDFDMDMMVGPDEIDNVFFFHDELW